MLGDPVDFVDPKGKNPILLGALLVIGLSEWLNTPSVAEPLRDDVPPTSLLLPMPVAGKTIGYMTKSKSESCLVARWSNPATTRLKSNDWVMLGSKNFKNWVLSGKMTPLNPKYHVPYNLGRTFSVPRKLLRYPKGWEKFKGLPPWNQRQIR